MSLLDILLVLIIGSSVLLGFMSGFAKVGIGFIATICGILFGFWFYAMPAAWFHGFITSTTICNVLGFVVVFLVFELLGALIAKIVSKVLKWTGLSFFDRLLGAAFGFVLAAPRSPLDGGREASALRRGCLQPAGRDGSESADGRFPQRAR